MNTDAEVCVNGVRYGHGDSVACYWVKDGRRIKTAALIVGIYLNEDQDENKEAQYSVGIIPYTDSGEDQLTLLWYERTITPAWEIRSGICVR